MGGQVCSAAAAIVAVVCVLLADVSPAWAQAEGIIRGQVVAAADGSALQAASVTLAHTDRSRSTTAVADTAGRFTFHDVPPGQYLLTVTAPGFSARDARVLIEPREVRSITVSLDVGQLALSVDVTAEGTQAGTHSPSSTMLTPERLDQMPLAQRTNLPDAIVTAAPGMIRGHDDFVHIRGHEVALNPSINGVQFWENAHSVFSPGLGVDYIDSINVMTGGFSAEYGNRFGGILDVVTKSGFTMQQRGSVTLGMGTAQRRNDGAEFGTRSDRTALYANVGGFMSDRFLSPPSPRSIHNTGRGLRSFARLDFRGNERNRVNLVVTGDGVTFELPIEERDETLRPDVKNLQRARSQSLILSWNHSRSPATAMQTSFYQRWSQVHQFPDTTDTYGAQTDAERTLATFGVKTDVTRFVGRHAIKAGADLVLLQPRESLYYLSQPWIDFTHLPEVNETHVHFRGENLGAGIPRPVVFNGEGTGGQASVYVQSKLQMTANLTVDAGVRFDRYSLILRESHLSPRVNAAYEFPAGTVLFGSYNHFFVPPPIENILVSSAGLTSLVSEIGRPLAPVQAITEDQFEAGVTQPIGRMGTVSLTGYHRSSDEPPHTSIFPDSRFYTYATFDSGKAYGMEIKLSTPRIGGRTLSGYLNYALGRVWFYNPIVGGFTTEAAHLTETSRFLAPMDQTHTATAGLTYYHARSGMWAGVSAEYGSGTPGGHGSGDHQHADGETHDHGAGVGLCGARCEARLIPNLSIGWNAISSGHQPRLSLQLTIENLSNKMYLLSKESTMVQGQYSHPRLISASLRFRF
jgi:outer membrane receptor for ferrienterochelin and colicins